MYPSFGNHWLHNIQHSWKFNKTDLLQATDLMKVVEIALKKANLNTLIRTAGLNHFALAEHQSARANPKTGPVKCHDTDDPDIGVD
ncbi:hypothetical protein [Acinetobacter sp. GSS19]|uniref:hypothetical protein n=1 Tax=Acinetobacter sp. GSS19 TaxID=3020716 RepID=UPI002362DB9A|nr:hypothetical protein [Acinetobacter sp. GSS19]